MKHAQHTNDTSWFSEEELPGLMDFWRVYDSVCDEMQSILMAPLMEHPTFGPILAATPKEQQDAQNAESRQRLAHAIEHGEWTEYDKQLRMQGAMYAGLGVNFRDWYDVVRLFGRYLFPKLVAAYGTDLPRLTGSVQSMQEFLDLAMAIIGESYIDNKEAAVRASEERLAITLNSIGDAVIATDTQGRIERLNPVAEALTGWKLSECKGRPLSEVFRIENEDTGAPIPNPVERVLQDGVVVGLANHTVLVCRDGRRLPIADSAAPIRRPEGDIHGVVLAFRDISEERAATALELQSRKIQEASRLKSEFLANMSHELRTPLNAIIGFAEMLYDGRVGPVQPKQQEFLDDILTSGRHLLQLINDVLDLSKVEAGKMEFDPQIIDLSRVVSEVISILRTSAASKQIHVEMSISPDIGEVVLDAARLKQVLYNYLSNALKFTPDGGKVSVRIEPEEPSRFKLTVEDTGIGVSLADQQRLFVEFQQLAAGASKTHGGTGLGLALAKRLVEAQGGSVGITSEVGVGSRFHAVLPCRASGGPREHSTPRVPNRRAGAPTVLVVEDDPKDQETIAHTLIEAGYSVEFASTGERAIAMASERTYEAVTLDIILPDMSGIDVLKTIRAGKNQDIPIVLITVVAEKTAVGFLVSDVLSKPLEPNALLSALSRAGVVPESPGIVLVVDDDAASLKLMAATLERLRYQPVCYSDGESALRAIAMQKPRAIILDLLMPGIDGFQFLSRLRESPAYQDIPVLIWTIKDLSLDELKQLRTSAEIVMQKGKGISEVVAELAVYLGPLGVSTQEGHHGA